MTQPTCEIRRCKRDASRLTFKGGLGTRVIAHICTFHWNLVSFLTAPWRFTALWTHRLKTMRVDDNLALFALHKGGTIYVTEHFATLTPEQMVYVLSHETLHHILNRDKGLLTSIALDIFYRRPLTCLRGHSIHTWNLNMLYPTGTTKPLNSTDV